MIIVLFQGGEITVTQAVGEKIKKAITKPNVQFVEVNGSLIQKNNIAAIKPGGLTSVDMQALESVQRSHELTARSRSNSNNKLEPIGKIMKGKK